MGKLEIDLGGNAQKRLEELWKLVKDMAFEFTCIEKASKVALNPNAKGLEMAAHDLDLAYSTIRRMDKTPEGIKALENFNLKNIGKARKDLEDLFNLIRSGIGPDGATGAGKNIAAYKEMLKPAGFKLQGAGEKLYANDMEGGLEDFREAAKQIAALLREAKRDFRTGGDGTKKERPHPDTQKKNGPKDTEASPLREAFDDAGDVLAKKISEADVGEAVKEGVAEAAAKAMKNSPPADKTQPATMKGMSVTEHLTLHHPMGKVDEEPLSNGEVDQIMALSGRVEAQAGELRGLGAALDELFYITPKTGKEFRDMVDSISISMERAMDKVGRNVRHLREPKAKPGDAPLESMPDDETPLPVIEAQRPFGVLSPGSREYQNEQRALSALVAEFKSDVDSLAPESPLPRGLLKRGELENEVKGIFDAIRATIPEVLKTSEVSPRSEGERSKENDVEASSGEKPVYAPATTPDEIRSLLEELERPLEGMESSMAGRVDDASKASARLLEILEEYENGGRGPSMKQDGDAEDQFLDMLEAAGEKFVGDEADGLSETLKREADTKESVDRLNETAQEIREAVKEEKSSKGSGSRRGTVKLNGQQIPLSAFDNDPELREMFLKGAKGNTSYGKIARSAEKNTRMRQEEQDLRMARMAARIGRGGDNLEYMDPNGSSNIFKNLAAIGAGQFSKGKMSFDPGKMFGQAFSDSLASANFNHALMKSLKVSGPEVSDVWKTDAVWDGDTFKEAIQQTQAFADLLQKVNSELEEEEAVLSKDDLYAKLKNKEIGRGELTDRLTSEDMKGLRGGLTRKGRKELFDRIKGSSSDRAIAAGGIAKSNAGKGVLGGLAGIAKFAGPIGIAVSGVVKMGEAVVDLGKKSVEAYEQVQSLQTQLGVVFGSQSASSGMFQEIEAYAKKSPFGVADMTQGAIGLKQAGVYGADLMDTLKSIGDLSSGNKEKFKSITDVYSRVMSSTTVTARDMRQLANAGVASYSALSKATGIDRTQIRSQLQAGNIKSADFQKMVEMLTTNGGMFEGATKKGAATVEARMQNLSDAKQMAQSEIGRGITNLGFDGENSIFSKLLGAVENINQNVEEHFKKVNDKKDSEAAEKAEKKYAELIKKANEAEAKGNFSESDKLFDEANTILNGDSWSKSAQANISRYERAKARLEKANLSIYSEQDLDRGELAGTWNDFKKKRDEVLSELLDDFNQEQEAITFGVSDMGLSRKDALENKQSVLNAYAEKKARDSLEESFATANKDFDFEKLWAAFHDAAGNEINSRESFYAEQAGTPLDGENAVSIAQDASVQMAGYMHDANEVFSKGFAWIDAQTQAVDKWVDITSKGVGDLEAAQNRMNSAQTDWVQNSPLAQMMSRDEKARRDEVLKGRITEMADKTYNKDTGNYEFGGLDITEFVEAEKLLTATAEEMSFEFNNLTKPIDDGFGNTKTVISEQGAETLETFRANLNEYYESLLNSNPTEYLDNDTLEHFKSLWEGLAGDISQFDETKITEIGKLINVIGESLEKSAASGDERAQAALTGYKNTGTRMTRDASKAQYLNKRKQADLWAQILSQATGVDASRVQLSGQKAVMDAYTKNFARRDMFSTLGKALMKNGASLKELSDILEKNSEGMSGGKGMFDWVSASREAEELAAKRNVETQDALIAAYQQQIDALSDLEMAGVATRDTWDNLTSLSAQLGTGFTLAAQEMADGTYRFTEETIRAAEKMKRELDMRKVVQQMDSIFNGRIQELNQGSGEAQVGTYSYNKNSYSVSQAEEFTSLLNNELKTFSEANTETLSDIIRNSPNADKIFPLLASVIGKDGLDIDLKKLNQDTTKTITQTVRGQTKEVPASEYDMDVGTLKAHKIHPRDIVNAYLTDIGLLTKHHNKLTEAGAQDLVKWNSDNSHSPMSEAQYINYLQTQKQAEAMAKWRENGGWRDLDKILKEKGVSDNDIANARYSFDMNGNVKGKRLTYLSESTKVEKTVEYESKIREKTAEENKLADELKKVQEMVKKGELGNSIGELQELLNLIYSDFNERMKESIKALDRNTHELAKKDAAKETATLADQITRFREAFGWDTREKEQTWKDTAFGAMDDWMPTRNHINWWGEDRSLEWLGLPTDLDFGEVMGRLTRQFGEAGQKKSVRDEGYKNALRLYAGGTANNVDSITQIIGNIAKKEMLDREQAQDRYRGNQMVGSYLQRNMDSILFGMDSKIGALLASSNIPKDLSADAEEIAKSIDELAKAESEFSETLTKALTDGVLSPEENLLLEGKAGTVADKRMELENLKNSSPEAYDAATLRNDAEKKKAAIDELRGLAGENGDLVDENGIVDEGALARVIELMQELGLVTGDAAAAFEELTGKSIKEVLAMQQMNQIMEDFGNEVKNALKAAAGDALLTTTKKLGENFYKMENSLMTQEECAEDIKKSLAGQAAAMIETISKSAVDAGLKLIGAGAMENNWGMIAAGLGLAAAGGFGGIASGLLSGYANDSSKDESEEKMRRLEALKNNLADLLKQARDDAEYYEVNLRDKKAISTNEEVSSLKVTKTNDMILSPNGVFSTAPDDYIFAMKDPASLTRGNGGDVSVNFSIVNQSGTPLNVSQSRRSYNRDTGQLDLEVVVNGIVRKSMMDGDYDDVLAGRDLAREGTPSYA